MTIDLISRDDMRAVFSRCADEITSGDPRVQLGSVGNMLNVVSNYLIQKVDGIDTTVITLLLEELNNIKNGNDAKFIKSGVHGGGRPIHAGKNAQQAALCAAIQILRNNGTKKRHAVEKVADWSGRSNKKLSNLLADFMKGNKSRDATALMQKWVDQQKHQQLNPERRAAALVEVSLTIGE